MAALGFGIADPVAAIVYKGSIIRKESLFITKSYDGITFLEYINSGLEFEKREETLNAFMALLGRFYQRGFVHGDPNLTNFLVHEQNGKPDFAFIDLDSIKHLPLPIHLYTFKSLAKLYSFALLTMSESNAVLVHSKEKGLRLVKTFLKCYNQKIEVSKAQKYILKNVRYW